MKKTKIYLLNCITLSLFLSSFAENSIAAGTHYTQGTVLSDKVFYQIGGGPAIMPPPSRKRPHEFSIGLGWKANLMCGKFDFKTSIKNQLNGITEGFKDLYGNIMQSATGAVASLPAMVIQRANPQLYDTLTNGLYQAKLDFDSLKTSCEEMSNKLADYAMDSKWAKMAGIENYKNIAANEPDIKKAKKQSEEEQGINGMTWIGGKKRGGRGQEPIELLKDVVSAGFNMSVGRGVTEKNTVSESQCDGMLCTTWKSPAEAAEYARKVLGDKTLTTCTTCGTPTKTQAGLGLAPEIEKRTAEKATQLETLLNAKSISSDQLAALSTSTISITRGLIEALKEDPDAPILGARLAQELAIAAELEKALVLRRMILVGMKEPNVALNEEAQNELEKNLKKLDREIEQVKLEMDLQRAISSNTAISILNSRIAAQQRALESNSSDRNNRLANLMDSAGSNELDNSNQNNFSDREFYIVIPKPNGDGLAQINGQYAPGHISSGNSSGISPSLQKFQSKDAYADGRATVYRTPDGKLVRREGGSLAWRNNNPGNIRMTETAKALGAIGVGPDGFAIFPDVETGVKALDKLLQKPYYQDLSVYKAIEKYAPFIENNTEAYRATIKNKTGIDLNRKMANLSADELIKVREAIRHVEGWKVGNEKNIS